MSDQYWCNREIVAALCPDLNPTDLHIRQLTNIYNSSSHFQWKISELLQQPDKMILFCEKYVK